ncbi:MAG: choice-of-anchor A family protein [Desulfovibrionaceae bacterium]|nr:choice-of-anchor A family protein [Desulfovibrionaceae bacterium]
MRRHLGIILFALALAAIASPALASPSALGVAGNYNGFIFNNFKATADTEGRLAVGGNMHVSGYSVGDKLPARTTGDVLVVGNNLSFRGGRVYHGDVRVGGKVTGHPGYKFYDGSLYERSAMAIDFAAEKQSLTNLSASLAGLAATGTTANYWGGMQLFGDAGSDLQVFNVSGADLLSGWGLGIMGNVDPSDTIVINVSGQMAGFTGFNMESLRQYSSNILFNFHEATSLALSGVAVWGSILAPNANINHSSGVLNGTLIANSFHGSMQLNNVPFEGNLPTPIPGTVFLLGTGLAGLLGWRKRR